MKIKELFEQRFDPYEIRNAFDPKSRKIEKIKDEEHLISLLKSDYSTVLKAYQDTGKVLYRGISSSEDVIITKIREDRLPHEMDLKIHEKLHKAFLDIGLKATRKNSIFCSAQKHIADEWGRNVYVILVRDPWVGTVFKTKKDDYTFYDMKSIGSSDNEQEIQDAIKKMNPMTFNSVSGLSEVLDDKYADILITGDFYIGIKEAYWEELAPKLGVRYKPIFY